MTRPRQLEIADLDRGEALDVLARTRFGRLAFTFRDRVDIEPISYVYADEWLYLRTSPGTKLTTLSHHPYAAFEVDEVRDHLHWTSVVVRGTVYFIDPERGGDSAAEFQAAVGVLRSVNPEVFTDRDPAPFRNCLFRMRVDEVVGRAAGR